MIKDLKPKIEIKKKSSEIPLDTVQTPKSKKDLSQKTSQTDKKPKKCKNKLERLSKTSKKSGYRVAQWGEESDPVFLGLSNSKLGQRELDSLKPKNLIGYNLRDNILNRKNSMPESFFQPQKPVNPFFNHNKNLLRKQSEHLLNDLNHGISNPKSK